MKQRMWSKGLAEFIGTLAIVFFGCGAIALSPVNPEISGFIPLIFGTTVGAMIFGLGHLSGAHFNPAVTIAFATVNRFPKNQVLSYIMFQVSGAMVGAFLVQTCFPESSQMGITLPAVKTSTALLVEVVLTFFLMLTIISVATDTRAHGKVAGLPIGAVVMIGAYVGGPLTGASMNPARSFGPALIGSNFHMYWIYAVAPIAGAIAAALLYESIRCEPSSSTRKQVKGCC